MKRRRKVLLFAGATLVVLIAGLVVFIGPWPTYGSGFENRAYYRNALGAIKRRLANAGRFAVLSKRLLAGIFGALALRLVLDERK